jgi:hypothetical protein
MPPRICLDGKVSDILCEQTIAGSRALCLSLTGGDDEIFPFCTRHDDDDDYCIRC